MPKTELVLVGLGIRIFDRGQAHGPGLPANSSSNYSSLARYDLRVPVGATPKKEVAKIPWTRLRPSAGSMGAASCAEPPRIDTAHAGGYGLPDAPGDYFRQ
jgi:hypothetical protein